MINLFEGMMTYLKYLVAALVLCIGGGAMAGLENGAPTSEGAIQNAQRPSENMLYPDSKPNKEGHLQVSEIHSIYYAEYGNPNGQPVLYVHGGPGGGVSETSHRLFDPEHYRIIIVEQRGAMRSKPFVETKENTTQDLVKDFERLRKHLGVEKWILLGGSWGSALSLVYAETYPERVKGLILRGVFLATKDEVHQLMYGMKDAFPEYWEKFSQFIPEEERGDLIKAYGKRLLNPDPEVHEAAAQSFCEYDFRCATLLPSEATQEKLQNKQLMRSISTLFMYYALNHFFMEEDQIEKNLDKIKHLPVRIVQGRYDAISRAMVAYKLHKRLPNSKIVLLDEAGHSQAEPATTKALIEATNEFKKL